VRAVDRNWAWVTAMDAPSMAWAASDLTCHAKRVDDAAAFAARMHELVDAAGDADLAAHAEAAHWALWRLSEGMSRVAARLGEEAEELSRE
jgi:hypothetical protein